MTGRLEMILIRVGLAVYSLVLSFLLLAPEPLRLLGFASPPGSSSLRLAHFGLFTVLAFLVWASRLPLRPGVVLGLLVAYALGTETLQWLIPTRGADSWDYLENLVGVAAGGAAWRALRRRGSGAAAGGVIKPDGNHVESPSPEGDEPTQSRC